METTEITGQDIVSQVLHNPRLRHILENNQPDKKIFQKIIGQLLLEPAEKELLTTVFDFRLSNFPAYMGAVEDCPCTVFRKIEATEKQNLEKLLENESLSLRMKVLQHKSNHYQPLIHVYEVPKHSEETNFRPLNILFLNRAPNCYQFNEDLQGLLEQLYKKCFFKALVFSATTVDALPLLKTRGIHAIYNKDDGSRSGPRVDKDTVMSALRFSAGEHKDTRETKAVLAHVKMLPMNTEYGDRDEFLELLAKVQPSEMRTLF